MAAPLTFIIVLLFSIVCQIKSMHIARELSVLFLVVWMVGWLVNWLLVSWLVGWLVG